MLTIKTPDNYYHESDKIFASTDITLKPGLTILVGCNGSGKSTFLKMIAEHCKENDIPCFQYDRVIDGGERARERYLATDFKKLLTSTVISEGENVLHDFADYIGKIKQFVMKHKNEESIAILIDAIDSGLSIDAIRNLKRLFHVIAEDCQANNIDAYIVIAANSYELACYESCLYPAEVKFLTFGDYDTYSDFIMDTNSKTSARYKALKDARHSG